MRGGDQPRPRARGGGDGGIRADVADGTMGRAGAAGTRRVLDTTGEPSGEQTGTSSDEQEGAWPLPGKSLYLLHEVPRLA